MRMAPSSRGLRHPRSLCESLAMIHVRTWMVVLFVFLVATAACREGESPESLDRPEGAVVAWLAAVDRGDLEAAADLAPPGSGIEADDLSELLDGARRDEASPFGMSPVEDGRATARVRLRKPAGLVTVVLQLEEQGGRWFVLPGLEEEPPEEPRPDDERPEVEPPVGAGPSEGAEP